MGIQEDIKEIKELVKSSRENKVKEKNFKFPFGKKVGPGQRRKNFVTTLVLNENGTYDFKKYQVQDQAIMHNFIPRLATAGHVMFDKRGNPLIILPNWSVEPFSPLTHYQQSLIDGSNTKGFEILMAKMEKEKIAGHKPVSGIIKWVIGLGLAGIIIYALLTGGGS